MSIFDELQSATKGTLTNNSELFAELFSHEPSNPHEVKHRTPLDINNIFISDFLSDFDRIKGNLGGITQDYKNFIQLPAQEEYSLFLNKLTSVDKGQSLLENVPRSVLGDLQPYIKLFLTYGMSEQDYVELPLLFNNFSPKSETENIESFSEITRSRAGRGVGFKSFSWDFLGTHPGEIQHIIQCKLRLYCESPQALFHMYQDDEKKYSYSFASLLYRRGNREGGKPKYTEDILETAGHGLDNHLNFDQRDHRVKIEIGYALPSAGRLIDAFVEQGFVGDPKKAANDFREAMQENKVSLYLNLTKHTFVPIFSSNDFSFEMEIDFQGSIEAAFESDDANILIEKNPEYESIKKTIDREYAKFVTRTDHLKYLTREYAEDVTYWDLGNFSGATEKETNENIKKEYDNLVADEIATYATFDKRSGPGHTRSIAGGTGYPSIESNKDAAVKHIKEFLETKNTMKTQERKLFLNQSSRLERYRNITCKLNNKQKIYNIKIKNKFLETYFEKRKGFVNQETLSEEAVEAAKQMIASSGKTEEEKRKLKRKIRASQKGRESRANSYETLSNYFFGESKTTADFQADKEKLDVKIRDRIAKPMLADAAARRNPNVSEEEYSRFIKNEIKPDSILGEGTYFLYWFYYGDLLDTVLDILTNDKIRKDIDVDFWTTKDLEGSFKIVLGNIHYIDRQTGQKRLINISKVPISLELWEDFWHKFVVTKGREVYYFKNFLRDTFSYLVKAALTNSALLPGEPSVPLRPSISYIDVSPEKFDQHYQIVQLSKVQENQAYYITDSSVALGDTSIGMGGTGTIESGLALEQGTPWIPYTTSTLKSAKSDQRILYMFNGATPVGFLKGDEGKSEDNEIGIYHVVVGQQNTPLSQISFQKYDQPYWIEAKAHKSGYLQKNLHFSEPYSCNFSTYGLSFLRPGTLIYIRFPVAWLGSPQMPGSQAQALGLGGYFQMYRTSHMLTLLPGGGKLDWLTEATCWWENFGGTEKKAIGTKP